MCCFIINRRTLCVNYSVNRTVDTANERLRSNSFLIPKDLLWTPYVDSLYIYYWLIIDLMIY